MATTMYSLIIAVFVTLSQSMNPKVCENYDQCDDYDISGTSVLCSGASSCNYECFTFSGGHYIPCSRIPTVRTTNIKLGDITCSGEDSCNSVAKIESQKNLICSGYQSCYINTRTLTQEYENQEISARLDINCDGSESCMKVSSPGVKKTMISGKKQYCSGYSSCQGHTTLPSGYDQQIIRPANRASCYGAEGCAKATVEAGLSTLCMGSTSCYLSDISTTKVTVCAGYRSCQQSVINAGGGRVDAYGYQSAAESTIKDADLVRAEAYQALLNAVIDSNGSGGGNYFFTEFGAGKGATVICRNGDSCRVKCDGKGCKGLIYQCEPGATCSLSPKECKRNSGKSYGDTACPTLTSGTAPSDMKAIATLPQPYSEYDDEQPQSDADDIDEDAKQTKQAPSCPQRYHWNSLQNPSSCTPCQKKASCKGDRIREAGITTCAGERSCVQAKIVQTNIGGLNYLRCGGDQGCMNADITSKTRVYCTGQEGCQDAQIVANEYIACEGESSCQDTTLELKSGNTAVPASSGTPLVGLRCNGKDSCFRAQILKTSGEGALRCAGTNACSSASIDYAADVECTGYNSCRSSTIDTDNGNVDCMGEFSCLGSQIDVNSKNPNKEATVTIYGRLAGYTAQISADVVKAYANHALMAATIDSAGRDRMVVEAYSPLAALYSKIICRSGSRCMLKCKGSACLATEYICLPGARCQVRPLKCKYRSGGSYQGIECPTMSNSITEATLDAHLKELNSKILNDEEYKKLQIIKDDLDHDYIDYDIVDGDDELDLDEGIF